MLFAILPAYLLRAQVGLIPTTLLELATYAVLLAFLLLFWKNPEFRSQIKQKWYWFKQKHRVLLYLITAFLAVMLIAALITVDLRESAGVFKAWVIAPIIAAFLAYFTFNAKKDLQILIAVLAGSAAVLSLQGLIEYFLHDPSLYPYYPFRLNSVFTSANYLALFTVPITAGSFFLLLFDKEIWKKRFLSICLILATIINLAALFFTFSYGGYLGLFAALAITFILAAISSLSNKFIKAVSAVSLFILILLAGALTAVTLSSQKYQHDYVQFKNLSAAAGRPEIMKTTFEIIKNHPVLGTGLGTYEHGYQKYAKTALGREPIEPVVIHPHNIFLAFWVEGGGILGLLVFLVLLVYFYKSAWSIRHKDPALAYTSIAAMTALLMHGQVDTPYFKNDLSYLFWIIYILPFISSYLQHSYKHS